MAMQMLELDVKDGIPGLRSDQQTQQTFDWTFTLCAILNDCSQRTFAEWKQMKNPRVCYSEQK